MITMSNPSRYWIEQQLITHPDIIKYRQHSGALRGIAILRSKGRRINEVDDRYIASRYID